MYNEFVVNYKISEEYYNILRELVIGGHYKA